MKFKSPKEGNERIKSWFAFVPVTIGYDNGYKETRWLERVSVEQVYSYVISDRIHYSTYRYRWSNVKFID